MAQRMERSGAGGSQVRVGYAARTSAAGRYRHEALLYSGRAEFRAGAVSFLRRAVGEDAPALVMVSREKIELLRQDLGAEAARVEFADMAGVGSNPARIIAAWQGFVRAHDGAGQLYGIGEPVYPGRSAAELAECQLHEALLNIVFDAATPFWLLCPYDLEALAAEVIGEAEQHHPFLARGAAQEASSAFQPIDTRHPFDRPAPARPGGVESLSFARGDLGRVRSYVARRAQLGGLSRKPAVALVLAVNEIATNSLQHGGGQGELRVWSEDGSLVCEISDRGYITWALAGRLPPTLDGQDGGGLWLANNMCDLVQIFSSPGGTAIRLHQNR
jgi:anti-sigma regulatory factor (Ser/Thr protein kinase)